MYHIQELSFRLYILLERPIVFKPLSFDQILENHLQEDILMNQKIKTFQYFKNYLKGVYYSFYKEQPKLYWQRYEEILICS